LYFGHPQSRIAAQHAQVLDTLPLAGHIAIFATMNQQPAAQNKAQSQAQDAAGQEVWDEARLEEAMKRLKLLHIKVT
jgi:hypothetical protein